MEAVKKQGSVETSGCFRESKPGFLLTASAGMLQEWICEHKATILITMLVVGIAALQVFAGGLPLNMAKLCLKHAFLSVRHVANTLPFVQGPVQVGVEAVGLVFSTAQQGVSAFVTEYIRAYHFVTTVVVSVIARLVRLVLVWGITLYTAYHSAKGAKALYTAVNTDTEKGGVGSVARCIKESVLNYRLTVWVFAPIGSRVKRRALSIKKKFHEIISFLQVETQPARQKTQEIASSLWTRVQPAWQKSKEAVSSLWQQARGGMSAMYYKSGGLCFSKRV